MGDDDRGLACVGGGGMWELSVPSPQFFCDPKIALKINLLKKKTMKKQESILELIKQGSGGTRYWGWPFYLFEII